MSETTVIKLFPCSTLPPAPSLNDLEGSGNFIRESVKKLVRWWASYGLFFAKADAPRFIPRAIKDVRDAATDLEAEYSTDIP